MRTGRNRLSESDKAFSIKPNQRSENVTVTTKPSFRVSPPQRLFFGNMFRAVRAGLYRYDVSRDGQRFLLNTYESMSTGQLNVVFNWRGK